MKWSINCACLLLAIVLSTSNAAPQGGTAGGAEANEAPMPYEYKYDVEDAEKNLYFGANESGDESGKVIGGYRVWLPDGRLMTVEYTVDGDSGFVPKITFEENANPIKG